MADCNETKRLIIQDVKKRLHMPRPQGEHGLWKGFPAWAKLQEFAFFCVETRDGTEPGVWNPLSLCAKVSLE